MKISSVWKGLGLVVALVLGIVIGRVVYEEINAATRTSVSASSWRGGGARGNYENMLTLARTADSILVKVETWHDLRIDPDKWNLPGVVTDAIRSATRRFTVDSIVNYHADFTTQIIRDAQWLVGNTNIRIVVNTVGWECPGQPLCGKGS